MTSSRLSRSATLALLLAIIGAGLFLRTSFFRNFSNPEGGFFFYSIDAYDHLRRITLGVQTFPKVPGLDCYAGFPKGTGQIWSPLYDYILTVVAVVAGGSRAAIEAIGFFANPAYAAIAMGLIFLIGRRLFGSIPAGLAAALLLAASPGHISYTNPMNFDHHVFESLAVLLLISLVFSEKEDRLKPAGISTVAGTLMLAIFMWRGATIYWGLTFFRVLLFSLVAVTPRLARGYALGFAGAAAGLAAFCALDPWGNAGSISFGIVSWFHVWLLLAASIVLFAVSFGRDRRRMSLLLAAAACLVPVLLLIPQMRSVAASLLEGLAFFGRTNDPWLAANSELKGIFSRGDAWAAATYLTLPWFLAPVAVILALLRFVRGGANDRSLFAFLAATPLLAMGLVLRYTAIAGVMTALSGAYLLKLAWELWPDKRLRVITVATPLLLLLPTIPHYRATLASHLPPPIGKGLVGPAGVIPWIKEHTPPTANYLTPDTPPEYGILADWDMGARIYQLAGRPSLSTAFGWETYGFYEQTAFMATADETAAARLLEANRIRYVVLQAQKTMKQEYAIAESGAAKGKLPAGLPGPFLADRTMYARLLGADGAALRAGQELIPALGRYRLVFESEYLARRSPEPQSYYKVFEFVPGARITGAAPPGSTVTLRLPLASSRGRLFQYADQTRTGRDGRFSFTLPYSTRGLQGGARPTGPCAITDDAGRATTVEVSEEAVRNGEMQEVAF